MNITELERDIKKELRASMNGILSARMREAGMPFRLIFGVELPRLRSIADEFPQDNGLANHLWGQSIRETRLLAIMLMPPETFTKEMANAWADTMLTAEEAQVLAMMLLPKTSCAKEICMAWIESGKPLPSVCACLCLRHLLVQGAVFSEEEQLFLDNKTTSLLPQANELLKELKF